LNGYAILDAPIFEKLLSPEMLAEHLKTVNQAMEIRSKMVSLTIGVSDAIVRTVEMPVMPLEDLRSVLKHSSRNYLQQDMSNYVFDCFVLGAAPATNGQNGNGKTEPKAPTQAPKQRVLIAGARKQQVEDYVNGTRNAGLAIDQLVPGLVGPVNTFEKSTPDLFANEAVALVDIGFKNSSICILERGELVLSRVVGIGGDRFTNDISESMKISYAEAEGIKIGMPSEVQSQVEATLMPLGRELRASIDFFEHQRDKTIRQVFVSGGSARSEFLIELLQKELMAECQALNSVSFLQLELPPQQSAEVAQLSPQLAVALGTALAAL
jgi:type IV pilus assembly protein PilM